jgi:hypothetical protein
MRACKPTTSNPAAMSRATGSLAGIRPFRKTGRDRYWRSADVACGLPCSLLSLRGEATSRITYRVERRIRSRRPCSTDHRRGSRGGQARPRSPPRSRSPPRARSRSASSPSRCYDSPNAPRCSAPDEPYGHRPRGLYTPKRSPRAAGPAQHRRAVRGLAFSQRLGQRLSPPHIQRLVAVSTAAPPPGVGGARRDRPPGTAQIRPRAARGRWSRGRLQPSPWERGAAPRRARRRPRRARRRRGRRPSSRR